MRKNTTLSSILIAVAIVVCLALPVVAFAQQATDEAPGMDWEKIIVNVVLAVIGLLLTIFAKQIDTGMKKYFENRWYTNGVLALAQLARDAVAKYAADHPEHEFPSIPERLLDEFIDRLKGLGLMTENGNGAAQRALAGAVIDYQKAQAVIKNGNGTATAGLKKR